MTTSALDTLRTLANLNVVWDDFWRRTGGKSAAGVDWITPVVFRSQLGFRLRELRSELERGYSFSALRGVAIPKKDVSKLRLICVPTIADRLVQRALLNVIEPRSAKLGILNAVSYGFVKRIDGGKGGTQGARQAAVAYRQKWPWAFKADISKFFDEIRREQLAHGITKTLNLRSLSPLIRSVISCEVNGDDARTKSAIAQNGIRVGQGLRQGMPLSPILSNFVLRDFDRVVGKQFPMVRYADDLLVFASTESERDMAADVVAQELDKLGLQTSAGKTSRHSPDEAIEFLGMELGLAQSKSTYGLTISQAQMTAIRANFQRYHSFDQADKDGLNAVNLFRRIEQMRIGYGSAYWGADNLEKFESQLKIRANECSTRVYGSIFGQDSVRKLNATQRRFLMLT